MLMENTSDEAAGEALRKQLGSSSVQVSIPPGCL